MQSDWEETSVSENGTNPDLWDKSHYGGIEEVAEWALQTIRETDDTEVMNGAKDLLVKTEIYMEKAYNQDRFELTGESNLDSEGVYMNIREEMKDVAHLRDETRYDLADNIRYQFEELEKSMRKE